MFSGLVFFMFMKNKIEGGSTKCGARVVRVVVLGFRYWRFREKRELERVKEDSDKRRGRKKEEKRWQYE